MWEMLVQSLRREDPLEEGMATHSSILAWRIPWAEEPGGLQSIGSQKGWTRINNLACMHKILFYSIILLYHMSKSLIFMQSYTEGTISIYRRGN